MAPSHRVLEIRFPPLSDHDLPSLQELLIAALQQFDLAAIEELDSTWRVFFDSPGATDEARELVERRFATRGAVTCISEVADEDWARRSQADLRAVTVGRLTIAPPWDDARRAIDPMGTIVIEPSMGFGTGHHATTRLCLLACQQIDLRGLSVVDIGTGSGVLAIAAARLGARTVTAVDCDADAVAAARRNLGLNGVDEVVSVETLDFRNQPGLRADVVMANLTGAQLAREAGPLAACVNSGGHLIVSGLLEDEEQTVRAAFESSITLTGRLAEDGWVALLWRRLSVSDEQRLRPAAPANAV